MKITQIGAFLLLCQIWDIAGQRFQLGNQQATILFRYGVRSKSLYSCRHAWQSRHRGYQIHRRSRKRQFGYVDGSDSFAG